MFAMKGPSMVKGSYPPAFPLKHQQKVRNSSPSPHKAESVVTEGEDSTDGLFPCEGGILWILLWVGTLLGELLNNCKLSGNFETWETGYQKCEVSYLHKLELWIMVYILIPCMTTGFDRIYGLH
jgi:hypothetical protein